MKELTRALRLRSGGNTPCGLNRTYLRNRLPLPRPGDNTSEWSTFAKVPAGALS